MPKRDAPCGASLCANQCGPSAGFPPGCCSREPRSNATPGASQILYRAELIAATSRLWASVRPRPVLRRDRQHCQLRAADGAAPPTPRPTVPGRTSVNADSIPVPTRCWKQLLQLSLHPPVVPCRWADSVAATCAMSAATGALYSYTATSCTCHAKHAWRGYSRQIQASQDVAAPGRLAACPADKASTAVERSSNTRHLPTIGDIRR